MGRKKSKSQEPKSSYGTGSVHTPMGVTKIARRRNKVPKVPPAGPVTVTKADGTVTIRPALARKQIRAAKM